MSVFFSVFAGVSVYSQDLMAKNKAPQMRSAITFSAFEVDT